jgi:hypothetical protein
VQAIQALGITIIRFGSALSLLSLFSVLCKWQEKKVGGGSLRETYILYILDSYVPIFPCFILYERLGFFVLLFAAF